MVVFPLCYNHPLPTAFDSVGEALQPVTLRAILFGDLQIMICYPVQRPQQFQTVPLSGIGLWTSSHTVFRREVEVAADVAFVNPLVPRASRPHRNRFLGILIRPINILSTGAGAIPSDAFVEMQTAGKAAVTVLADND